MADEKYVFFTEWYDSAASLVRQYNLIYFLNEKMLELVTYFPSWQVRS